jgi:uncharacterized protein
MSHGDSFTECGLTGTPLRDTFVMDSHCHLGPLGRMRILDSSADSLVRTMDRLGVDIAAASALPACIDGAIVRGNDIVIDAVQRYPERIFGYLAVNPLYRREAQREMTRCWRAGLRGLKVHNALGPRYDHPAYVPVWEFADAHQLPVLVHTWGSDIAEIEPCFERYPHLTWIAAHGGAEDPEIYVRIGTRYANVYVDTTFSRAPRGLIEWFVANGLEDRLLWGTDAAFLAAPGQLGRLLFAKISPAQKEKILGLNARQAFRLSSG